MTQTTSSVDTMAKVGTAMIQLSSDMIIVDDSYAASDIIHGVTCWEIQIQYVGRELLADTIRYMGNN